MVNSGENRVTRRGFVFGGAAAAGAVALARFAPPALADPLPERVQGQLRTFNYSGVRLLGSRWKTAQDEAASQYLNVPTDNYLRGFRVRAGLPAPGEELGGWYSDDVFHDFGQIVSGLSRYYAASGEKAAQAKVHKMATGFAECIADDGYFFYTRNPNARHYVYEKMLCGLLDAWLYCGSETARGAMDRITAWAMDPNNLERSRPYGGGGEWYTLSENLYRAYLATGDTTYRDFARVWEYRGFWDHFYRQEDFFQTPEGSPVAQYHAYSHVNSLSGLGAAYLATGEEYHLTALRNAYDMLRSSQAWVTGGYGPYEWLLPGRAELAATLEPFHNHFETQCGSWAVLKVSKYLTQITGQARFGDWAEQVLYNGVGATGQPMSADGRVQYYTAYSPRGGRKINVSPWSCCTGTRSQAWPDLTDQVFLHDQDRLLVNLFLPARVNWDSPAGPITARVDTDFPDTDRVGLVLDRAPGGAFTTGFRSPGWLAGQPEMTVNGQPVPAVTDENGWITIRREWRRGDRIEVRLPMDLRDEPFLDDRDYPTAVVYGPVALCFGTKQNPMKDAPAVPITKRMQRKSGNSLRWLLADRREVEVRPFYDFELDERYFLYLNPNAGLYIHEEGDWGHFSWLAATVFAGDSSTVEFEGPNLRWNWIGTAGAGIARVEIDGEFVQDVDQYSPTTIFASTEFTDLGDGSHVIRVECTGRKNLASGGTQIIVLDYDYNVTAAGSATRTTDEQARRAEQMTSLHALQEADPKTPFKYLR